MRFLATAELGRLCKWLRILGYDCEYCDRPGERNSSSLKIRSLQEDRVILTRNVRLGKRTGYKVVRVESDHVNEQLRQVLEELRLDVDEKAMFTRCILCNLPLESVARDETKGKVPPFVFETNDDFVKCGGCGRIYWQGTHWGNVRQYLDGIRS